MLLHVCGGNTCGTVTTRLRQTSLKRAEKDAYRKAQREIASDPIVLPDLVHIEYPHLSDVPEQIGRLLDEREKLAAGCDAALQKGGTAFEGDAGKEVHARAVQEGASGEREGAESGDVVGQIIDNIVDDFFGELRI